MVECISIVEHAVKIATSLLKTACYIASMKRSYRTAAAFAGVGIALSASACGTGVEKQPELPTAPHTTDRVFPANVRTALEQT